MTKKRGALRETGMVMVGARLPVDLYKRAHHYRVDHEMSLRELLERALVDYIEKDARTKLKR